MITISTLDSSLQSLKSSGDITGCKAAGPGWLDSTGGRLTILLRDRRTKPLRTPLLGQPVSDGLADFTVETDFADSIDFWCFDLHTTPKEGD